MAAKYERDKSGRYWWCNSHNRRATHVLIREGIEDTHVCDGTLGGILLPCLAVDLTDELEVSRDVI